MNKMVVPAFAALALSLATPAIAANKDSRGYGSDQADLAARLPIHVVALNTKVRPQLGFRYRPVGAERPPPPEPHLAAWEMAAGGGLLGAAIAVAGDYVWHKRKAQENFEPIEKAGCDLQVDAQLQQGVVDAIGRSTWGAKASPVVSAANDRDLDKLISTDEPRHVFAVTMSLSPDLIALVTSVEVAAYAHSDGRSDWKKTPAWKDQLFVVSDLVEPPAKTQADIERMTAEEQARYEASGADALIKKVNARQGDQIDRKNALDAMKLHKKNMAEASLPQWSAESIVRERATMWTQDKCRRMQAAVAQAGSEAGRMLDALYAEQLPLRLALKDEAIGGFTNERHIRALPGGIYLSQTWGGVSPPLGYRYDLLPMED